MVKNLKNNGTVFNYNVDDNSINDLLEADIKDDLVIDENILNPSSDKTFEDED